MGGGFGLFFFSPQKPRRLELTEKFCSQESMCAKATVVVVTDDFINKLWIIWLHNL